MRYFNITCAFIFLILYSQMSWSTEPYLPTIADPLAESWRWRHFPELEGKGVRCMVEDKAGNMWFGANDGLIEYDGYNWKWHTAENGLLGMPVEQLYSASNDHLYAATPKGLFLHREGKWKNVFPLKEDLEVTFFQIRELSNGNILLCFNLGMVELQEDKVLRLYTSSVNQEELSATFKNVEFVLLPEEALQDRQFLNISDVLEIEKGRIWLAITIDTHGKILEFDLNAVGQQAIQQYKVLDTAEGNPFGESQKMLKAQDGTIWIINSSTNIGIHKFDGKAWEYVKLSNQFGGDEYVTDIAETPDGMIWVGAFAKLHTFKDGKWKMYASPEFNLPANRLMLMNSRNNQVWIGGQKSKVYRLDYSYSHWVTYENLNFQCESEQQELWFLDVNGKVIRNYGEQWTAYDFTDGLMDAPVRLIYTSKGQLWTAGSHEGVAATAYLKNGKWHRQLHPELSWGIDYRAVFEAKDGSLWFGGSVDFVKSKGQLGGVLHLKNPTARTLEWEHHKYHENGLLQSNAYGIAQSVDGRIWIGGGNLYFFDGQQWDRPEESCLRQYVNIVESTEDLLLVGSRYYGVYSYDGENWQHYDTKSGLISNTIISLHTDLNGRIWAATENDISCFDGENWVNHIFPAEMNMELEGGAILHSSDGAIWVNKSSRNWKRRAFSHNKAPTEAYQNFVAYKYMPDHNPPNTTIELYSEEVGYKGNTLISWQGEDFLGDTPDPRMSYSYRLKGEEWSPFSNEKHHTFFNLSDGTYTFEVRARDLDFNIDQTPAVITFVVHPPVWKQNWFVILLLAFLLTVGILEYRVITKKQKLEKLNKSLNAINTELKVKNEQILQQQAQILAQKRELEKSNTNLEVQNLEILYQRDKLEEMVTQVEELSKAKVNFFTNISHELRTPLCLILGPIEQLKSLGENGSEKERKHLMEIIERNASRLYQLINQLLEVRRIENSTLELNPVKSDLGTFVADIAELFDNLAAEQRIQFSFENHCTNSLTTFDPDKVEKIIANLLSNAFKNTPKGGSIHVELNRKFVDKQLQFSIRVTDTGKGICPEKLPHIFERYYSDEQEQVSSGIGLAYIKELVELHGGRIEVESTKGKGTSFTVVLPANLHAEQKQSVQQGFQFTKQEISSIKILADKSNGLAMETASKANVQRILIVEDNKDMADFLETILHKKYAILKAENGKEGLRIAKNHQLDLIISDVMMPEMDGLTFCQCIKTDFATSHIPVVLLTAKNMDEHRIAGYQIGADDYICKPFNPSLLEVRLENLLQQRAQLRSKFNRDFALQPKEVELTSPDEELLQRIVQIMEEHISDSDFNVNKMCEMVHLSHMHFIRKVKQLTGKKPSDLLKSYRLKRAKDLLSQNKVNIAEVAYMVGYDLPNSFSRAFKKEFGYSPTEFVEREVVH